VISRLDPAIRPGIFHWRRMSHRLVCFFGYAQTSRRTGRKLPGKVAKRTDFIAKKHRNGPWTGL
jgi:hypothetical protein